MPSYTPDPVLQEMLRVRDSYFKKVKSNNTSYSIKNITARTKLLNLIEEDTTIDEFNAMLIQLTAIETAATLVENEFPILRNAMNEYKRSIDAEEIYSVQKEKSIKMKERRNVYHERWQASCDTLPFPNFAWLKTKLEDFSNTLDDTKPLGGVSDVFSKFYDNERKMNAYLMRRVDDRITFIQEYKNKLRKQETDDDTLIREHDILSLLSAAKSTEVILEMTRDISDDIQAKLPSIMDPKEAAELRHYDISSWLIEANDLGKILKDRQEITYPVETDPDLEKYDRLLRQSLQKSLHKLAKEVDRIGTQLDTVADQIEAGIPGIDKEKEDAICRTATLFFRLVKKDLLNLAERYITSIDQLSLTIPLQAIQRYTNLFPMSAEEETRREEIIAAAEDFYKRNVEEIRARLGDNAPILRGHLPPTTKLGDSPPKSNSLLVGDGRSSPPGTNGDRLPEKKSPLVYATQRLYPPALPVVNKIKPEVAPHRKSGCVLM
ncbi:MAG TPA: hypothetical protein VJN02_10515 [Gammaproteobacteria bacterium]|nr:hypothetical protein [Gammaproteobacteria bacterium]